MPEHTPPSRDPRPPTLDELFDRRDEASLQDLAARNEDHRAHIDMQRAIDVSLKRLFAEPDFTVSLPAPVYRFRRWAALAAAAVVLLAAAAGWRLWLVANRPDVLGPLYRQIVDAGFKPDSVCTTDTEFSGWCRSYLRQPLYPTSRPDGLEYVGWSTGRVIGPVSAILLVKIDARPVIVVMDRTDRQAVSPGRIADSSLYVFRKRIGEVVMYEVSPLPEARVLPVIGASPAP